MDVHELALLSEIAASSGASSMNHLDGHLLRRSSFKLCRHGAAVLDNSRGRTGTVPIVILMIL